MDEANRCLQCKVPQCRKGCPINTNIPEAIRLLKENKLDEAGKIDAGKLQAFAFDQMQNGYYAIGEKVGQAWHSGADLMKK